MCKHVHILEIMLQYACAGKIIACRSCSTIWVAGIELIVRLDVGHFHLLSYFAGLKVYFFDIDE